MYYMLLLGLSHTDQVGGLDVIEDEIGRQVDALIDGWFTTSASEVDC